MKRERETRGGFEEPLVPSIHPDEFATILAWLGHEMSQPTRTVRAGLERILDSDVAPGECLDPARLAHARTVIGLCDDLERLIRDTIGSEPFGAARLG